MAEVALFATDLLPSGRELNDDAVVELERSGSLVRFPTGSDGSYLLHVYVDQPIPPEITRYCVQEDSKSGLFVAASGAIAFGGVESAAHDFKPNENIRSDGRIPAGRYEYTAFHTEFPDEIVLFRPASRMPLAERSIVSIPDAGPPIAVLVVVVTLAFRQYALAGVLIIAAWWVIRMCRRAPVYKEWCAQRREHEMQYPSIVVSLRSNQNGSADSGDKGSSKNKPYFLPVCLGFETRQSLASNPRQLRLTLRSSGRPTVAADLGRQPPKKEDT